MSFVDELFQTKIEKKIKIINCFHFYKIEVHKKNLKKLNKTKDAKTLVKENKKFHNIQIQKQKN